MIVHRKSVTHALLALSAATAMSCSSGKFGDDPATLVLFNDKGYLKLDGSPIDSTYVGRYPNPTKVKVMMVEVLATGELAETCPNEGSTDCIDSPFTVKVEPTLTGADAKVFDLYGTLVAQVDLGAKGKRTLEQRTNLPEGGFGVGPVADTQGAGNKGGGGLTGTPALCGGGDTGQAQQKFCDAANAELARRNIEFRLDCSKLSADAPFTFSVEKEIKAALEDKDTPLKRCRDITNPASEAVKKDFGNCMAIGNWVSKARQALREAAVCKTSPLVVDLAGDGVALTSPERGVSFDLLGTGEAVQSAWIEGKDDALLAMDRNGNGAIDGAEELFGNVSAGRSFTDGFRALAELDGNRDGRVDAQDAQFSMLRLWQDRNHDGKSSAGELLSLETAGIRSFDLSAERLSQDQAWDAFGNDVALQASFVRKDGSRGTVVDAFLRFAPSQASKDRTMTSELLSRVLGPALW